LLDLPTQRRLGDVQFFSRAGEIQGAGQHPEVTQMAQFYDTSKVWRETYSILDGPFSGGQSLMKNK
jgi:hypothetical protein